ncbi:DUF2510 domain-containing protein [Yinghuangia sp. YIM S09857]|uniref:DUF2510 domain-containing protein n=1 Tax=Yinghuangia sp. YIM S09857 TaxID=3436929 RepID=UPI003F539B08
MTASIPPGWYDDPSASGMERWWDGTQWTESSRPRTDSSPGVPPAPGHPSAQQPAGYPSDQFQPGQMHSSGPGQGPNSGPGQMYGPGQLSAPGQTPYPPYGAYQGQGAPNRRNRNVVIAIVSVLVVGGLVAALIVLLGGGDDSKTATSGTLLDPSTGVSVPRIKDWDVPKPQGEPTHQRKDRVACNPASGGPSGGPSDGPSDAPGDCFLGESFVDTTEASSFEKAITETQEQYESLDGEGYQLQNTEKNERTKVDGKEAHILEYKVRDPADRIVYAQFVIIDAPVDREYPVLSTIVYDLPNAPGRAVFDTIRNGAKVGQPVPSDSAS